MATEVTLPVLGESVTEGTVSRWLKEVGETVEADEPLLEVSTDKVDTEIPAPVAGILAEIRVSEDEVAAVGSVLGLIIETGGAPATHTPEVVPAQPETQPEAQTPAVSSSSAATPVPAASTSSTEIILPALGESVSEGTVSRWLKEIGEEVTVDEPLVEVSTDKVDTEIPSPAAGILLEIRVSEDSIAQVGSVLGVVGTPTSSASAPSPASTFESPSSPAQTPVQAPVQPAVHLSQPTPAAAVPASAPNSAPRHNNTPESGYVTPLVRKMANDAGVDLATLTGTGVGGRIRKQDIIDAAAAAKAAAEAAAKAAAAATTAMTPEIATVAPATSDSHRGKTEKMSRLRQVVAARMTESLQMSAQLTATVEVDLSKISRLRSLVKDDFRRREGTSLTYLAFITKAVTEALKQFAKVNASIDTEAGTLTYHDAEHIGIAVDTPRGLLVPVIKDAGDLNVSGIAKKIADLASRTRDNKVTPDELGGGTFTITNYGSTGTLFDTPIINQPQVGILGTGALVKRPVVVYDEFGQESIAVRDMMYLSLTYDHRLVDGADASRFLAAVKARLEDGDFGAEFGI